MMSNKSKAKGNRFENECCSIAEQSEFSAKRAWGSDGRSLGKSPEVDIIIGYKDCYFDIQCKVRNKIAQYIIPPEDCNFTLLKQDRGEVYACIRYKDLLNLIKESKEEK
jgi:Holliday junction resolvase